MHVLRCHTDLQPRETRLRDDIAAEHEDTVGRRADETGHHPDERALARAVGPEQTEEAPRRDVQRQAAKGEGAVPVDLLQLVDPQGRALSFRLAHVSRNPAHAPFGTNCLVITASGSVTRRPLSAAHALHGIGGGAKRKPEHGGRDDQGTAGDEHGHEQGAATLGVDNG